MNTMNRRELLRRATSVVVATGAGWEECKGAPRYLGVLPRAQQVASLQSTRQGAKGQRTPLPASVAGVRLPDTKLAQAAVELAGNAYPAYLFNHALRTYVFGALAGKARKNQFDEEVLYIACVLHDVGLTSQFEGDIPFEIQGAQAAKKFLVEHGMSGERAEMVWDGIAMHASFLGVFKRAEISLVGDGAGSDVLGPDPSEIPADKVAETLSAFPRLKFKEQFLKSCADVVSLHPGGATRSFMRDIGERYVPSFHPRNFCDLVEKAPFEE